MYGDCDKFRQTVFQLATETEDNDSSLGKKSCNLSLMLMTCSRCSNLSIKRLSHDLGWSCAHVNTTSCQTRMPCKKHSAHRVFKFSKHCGKNVCEILPKSNLLKWTYQETSCRPVTTSLMSLIPMRRLWKDRPSMGRLNQHNKHNHQSDKVPLPLTVWAEKLMSLLFYSITVIIMPFGSAVSDIFNKSIPLCELQQINSQS